MTRDEAMTKAIKIADLLGISVTTKNKDGSETVRKPKPVARREIDMDTLINVIMK